MKTRDHGFTRLELIFAAIASALVALPAISLLASNHSESQRVLCANNLRQITRAFQSWANDHGDNFPWRVPFQDHGTMDHALAGNTWFQFSAISNHLALPRRLVCPADAETTKMADNWGAGPNGFINPANRNNANSYIVSLHARLNLNDSLLSGDRNIRVSATASSCSFLPQPVCLRLTPGDSSVGWTNAIHGRNGNLALADGSIFFASSSDLQTVVSRGGHEGGSGIHFLSK